MLKLLVIADDLTGANEVAVQFAKKGIATLVVPDWQHDWKVHTDEFQVVAINTESRHVSVKEAQRRMNIVLDVANCRQIPYCYKKTDSTLRGNIAAELDILRKRLGAGKIMFIPANPSMGRTVEKGMIFVQGKPLAESDYAKDPLEPSRENSIIRKLRRQLDAPYHLITRDILEEHHTGRQYSFEDEGCYVFDTGSEEELFQIGRLLCREMQIRVLAGSGGFATVLPVFIEFKNKPTHSLKKSNRRLFINGSLNPVAHRQIQWARSRAIPVGILEKLGINREECRLTDDHYPLSNWLREAYKKNKMAVLTTPSPEKLRDSSFAFHGEGVKWNEYLGSLIASLLQEIQIEVLVIFGGDTALAVLKALQLKRIEALSEIVPGVALLKSLNSVNNPLYLVTKPGGFGEENSIGIIESFFQGKSNEANWDHHGRRQRGRP